MHPSSAAPPSPSTARTRRPSRASGTRRALAGAAALALAACGPDAAPPLDLERFRGTCEATFDCACEDYGHADVDSCMRYHAWSHAGFVARAGAAGLTIDEACVDAFWSPEPDLCLSWTEYEEKHPETFELGTRCGECMWAHGEKQAGEPCSALGWVQGSDCAEGLVCLGRGDRATCVDPCVPAEEGAPCDNGVNTCAEGLHCLGESETCTAALPEGADCRQGVCGEGLICDEGTDLCRPPSEVGGPCRENGDCDRRLGLHCAGEYEADDGVGVCAPLPGEDEPCAPECAPGLECDPAAEVCRPLGESGAACVWPLQCVPGLSCIDGACAARPAAGEPCHENQCATGATCTDGLCAAEPPRVCQKEDGP